MSLNHVCVWDSETGYKRISAVEAAKIHPYGAPAYSGYFVCELCAQNVCFTKLGKNVQHFRHDSQSATKECEDRQKSFDPTYGHRLGSLNSHMMPLHIRVRNSAFSFEIGFFRPPNPQARCKKIIAAGDSHQKYEYSFERIEKVGISYLNLGTLPSQNYWFKYENATPDLSKFWPEKISGIAPAGSFFDATSGKILYAGGKAYWKNGYYLLRRTRLYSSETNDIEIREVAYTHVPPTSTWYLYHIKVNRFSIQAAKFFLKYSIFLTDRPTRFYPIWPAYTEDPYFIYHNTPVFYFYLCGDDAELKAYPASFNMTPSDNGRLYRLQTSEKEQLISLGRSGALGFTYLQKKELPHQTTAPEIRAYDADGHALTEHLYSSLPKSRLISILAPFDGKVMVSKKGRTESIYLLSANERLIVDQISFGTEIKLFQGLDCIRILQFEHVKTACNTEEVDQAIFNRLTAFHTIQVPTPHSMGTLLSNFAEYPRSQRWITKRLRSGNIDRAALQYIKGFIQEKGVKNR